MKTRIVSQLALILIALSSCRGKGSSPSPSSSSPSSPGPKVGPAISNTYSYESYGRFKSAYDIFRKNNSYSLYALDFDSELHVTSKYEINAIIDLGTDSKTQFPQRELAPLPTFHYEIRWVNPQAEDGKEEPATVAFSFKASLPVLSEEEQKAVTLSFPDNGVKILRGSEALCSGSLTYGRDTTDEEKASFKEKVKAHLVYLS